MITQRERRVEGEAAEWLGKPTLVTVTIQRKDDTKMSIFALIIFLDIRFFY